MTSNLCKVANQQTTVPTEELTFLERFKNPSVGLSIDQHLQYRTIEQMTPNQLRYLLEYGELIAA